MKKTAALLLVLLMLLAGGCASSGQHRYRAQFLGLFDTVTTFVGYADCEARFMELAQQLHDKLEEYHRLYTIYDDYEGVNNLKTINDNAGIRSVAVDARIIEMLVFAKQQCAQSRGAFNIALGSVLRIWHDYREAGQDDPEHATLPPMELLREAALHTNLDDVVIDEQAGTVFLRDPAMSLDVGAVAKGYATEQLALYARSLGVNSLLISVGGNVRAVGGKPSADAQGDLRWNVGIQNPDKSSPKTELLYVMAEDSSVVSSGVYERYYTVDGKRYHHIIDPATLMPADHYEQVTVLCHDSGMADALCKAAFILPLDEARAYIDEIVGVEAAWVMKDGSIEYSNGFLDFVKAS